MKVEYINHMGSDKTVVDSARVSFSKTADQFEPEQNERLIKYLAKHGHFTPFTHCMISLRERVPIFIARQRFKHQIGFSYNEISRRYIDGPPEFYTPDVWRKRAENKKQGSSDEAIDLDYSLEITEQYREALIACENAYDAMLDIGIAPEQARMVLPQSMYTEYVVTGSLAAFARAYGLRSEESAQKEIQDLAVKWNEIIRPLYPLAWSALVD